jgi:hypothetical protein
MVDKKSKLFEVLVSFSPMMTLKVRLAAVMTRVRVR